MASASNWIAEMRSDIREMDRELKVIRERIRGDLSEIKEMVRVLVERSTGGAVSAASSSARPPIHTASASSKSTATTTTSSTPATTPAAASDAVVNVFIASTNHPAVAHAGCSTLGRDLDVHTPTCVSTPLMLSSPSSTSDATATAATAHVCAAISGETDSAQDAYSNATSGLTTEAPTKCLWKCSSPEISMPAMDAASRCFGLCLSADSKPMLHNALNEEASKLLDETPEKHYRKNLSSADKVLDQIPESYGLHSLDRRTVLLSDGTECTYFALPMECPLPVSPVAVSDSSSLASSSPVAAMSVPMSSPLVNVLYQDTTNLFDGMPGDHDLPTLPAFYMFAEMHENKDVWECAYSRTMPGSNQFFHVTPVQHGPFVHNEMLAPVVHKDVLETVNSVIWSICDVRMGIGDAYPLLDKISAWRRNAFSPGHKGLEGACMMFTGMTEAKILSANASCVHRCGAGGFSWRAVANTIASPSFQFGSQAFMQHRKNQIAYAAVRPMNGKYLDSNFCCSEIQFARISTLQELFAAYCENQLPNCNRITVDTLKERLNFAKSEAKSKVKQELQEEQRKREPTVLVRDQERLCQHGLVIHDDISVSEVILVKANSSSSVNFDAYFKDLDLSLQDIYSICDDIPQKIVQHGLRSPSNQKVNLIATAQCVLIKRATMQSSPLKTELKLIYVKVLKQYTTAKYCNSLTHWLLEFLDKDIQKNTVEQTSNCKPNPSAGCVKQFLQQLVSFLNWVAELWLLSYLPP
ncbi:hypothetical protein ACP70R_015883 [Stipagrostis hirtigluma subsp. patula]